MPALPKTQRFSRFFDLTTWVCLGLWVIFFPWRMRWVVWPQPRPPLYTEYTDLLVVPGDVFLLGAILFWGLGLLAAPRKITGPRGLALPLAGLTVWAGLAAWSSVVPLYSAYHVLRLVVLGAGLLVMWNSEQTAAGIILPIILQFVGQAVVGILQVWVQGSVGLARLGELALDPQVSGVSVVGIHGSRFLRAYGLTDHPNLLGGGLAVGLAVFCGWVIGKKRSPRGLLAAGALAGVGLAALAVTFSRSGWLALAAGLGAAGALYAARKDWAALRQGGWVALAACIVAFPAAWQVRGLLGTRLNVAFNQKATASLPSSITERLVLLDNAAEMIAARPLTGVGLGGFPAALQDRRPGFPFDYQPVHLVLADAAAESGLPGAALLLAALAAPWLALWAERRTLVLTPELAAASAGLLAITVAGLFDYYPWMLAPGRGWQWWAWGIWGLFYLRAKKHVG